MYLGSTLVLSRKFRIFLNLAWSSLLVCKACGHCHSPDWAFSNCGLEAGLPAFQLPMFFTCDALPKGDLFDMIRRVCFRIPFLPFLWEMPSIHSRPEAWGPWEGQYAPVILHCACIMPIPSLQLQKKAPVSCREAKRLVTELWSPRYVTMLWLCSQLCYETAANQRTLVQIELLATVGWKWGCQPFSCRCSQNVPHCRKEICSTCSFKESIPAIPLGNAKHPLPTRSLRLLRAAVRSTSCALCLYYACKRSHSFVEDSGFVSWLSF